MDLSEEMKEAIRILREDGQIASYNKMTESHQALVERLDHMEDKISENAAAKKEETPDNTGGNNPPVPTPPETDPGLPTPPPENPPEPPAPEVKGRLAWWERDMYKHD